MTRRLASADLDWQRVSPRYVIVELVSWAITVLILAAVAVLMFVVEVPWVGAAAAAGALACLATAALTPRRVRAIGYALREDDFVFRRGVLFQRIVAVPYGRMQLVDINRGPLARALGLSQLKLVTAAAATAVAIDGLAAEDAERLRDHLVEVAETRRAGL